MRCADCKHFSHYGFDSEVCGDFEWFDCAKRPNVANLKQFPFQKTACADFERKP